ETTSLMQEKVAMKRTAVVTTTPSWVAWVMTVCMAAGARIRSMAGATATTSTETVRIPTTEAYPETTSSSEGTQGIPFTGAAVRIRSTGIARTSLLSLATTTFFTAAR